MNNETEELQLAGFCLGDNLFAVDIMRIREIVIPQKLSNFPLRNNSLDGMINLRGQVIPVMNLRAFFNMPPRDGGTGKLMIISVAGHPFALAIDDLDDVISVSLKNLAPPPELVKGVGSEYLIAVCLYSEKMYLVLDVDSLFVTDDMHQYCQHSGGGVQ